MSTRELRLNVVLDLDSSGVGNQIRELQRGLSSVEAEINLSADLSGIRRQLNSLTANVQLVADTAKIQRDLMKLTLPALKIDGGGFGKDAGKEILAVMKKWKPGGGGGGILGSVMAPFQQVFIGAFQGIGHSITRDLGKGISDGIERELAPIIGSFEMLGREATSALVKEIRKELAGSTLQSVEGAVRELVGESNVYREGGARLAKQQKARDKESREAAAYYSRAASAVDETQLRKDLATQQKYYEKLAKLREKYEEDLEREYDRRGIKPLERRLQRSESKASVTGLASVDTGAALGAAEARLAEIEEERKGYEELVKNSDLVQSEAKKLEGLAREYKAALDAVNLQIETEQDEGQRRQLIVRSRDLSQKANEALKQRADKLRPLEQVSGLMFQATAEEKDIRAKVKEINDYLDQGYEAIIESATAEAEGLKADATLADDDKDRQRLLKAAAAAEAKAKDAQRKAEAFQRRNALESESLSVGIQSQSEQISMVRETARRSPEFEERRAKIDDVQLKVFQRQQELDRQQFPIIGRELIGEPIQGAKEGLNRKKQSQQLIKRTKAAQQALIAKYRAASDPEEKAGYFEQIEAGSILIEQLEKKTQAIDSQLADPKTQKRVAVEVLGGVDSGVAAVPDSRRRALEIIRERRQEQGKLEFKLGEAGKRLAILEEREAAGQDVSSEKARIGRHRANYERKSAEIRDQISKVAELGEAPIVELRQQIQQITDPAALQFFADELEKKIADRVAAAQKLTDAVTEAMAIAQRNEAKAKEALVAGREVDAQVFLGRRKEAINYGKDLIEQRKTVQEEAAILREIAKQPPPEPKKEKKPEPELTREEYIDLAKESWRRANEYQKVGDEFSAIKGRTPAQLRSMRKAYAGRDRYKRMAEAADEKLGIAPGTVLSTSQREAVYQQSQISDEPLNPKGLVQAFKSLFTGGDYDPRLISYQEILDRIFELVAKESGVEITPEMRKPIIKSFVSDTWAGEEDVVTGDASINQLLVDAIYGEGKSPEHSQAVAAPVHEIRHALQDHLVAQGIPYETGIDLPAYRQAEIDKGAQNSMAGHDSYLLEEEVRAREIDAYVFEEKKTKKIEKELKKWIAQTARERGQAQKQARVAAEQADVRAEQQFEQVQATLDGIAEEVIAASGLEPDSVDLPKLDPGSPNSSRASGSYDRAQNVLKLGQKQFDALLQGDLSSPGFQLALKDAAHEYRHAIQFDFGGDPSAEGFRGRGLEATEDELRRLGPLIEKSVAAYTGALDTDLIRELESDAYVFADRFVQQFREDVRQAGEQTQAAATEALAQMPDAVSEAAVEVAEAVLPPEQQERGGGLAVRGQQGGGLATATRAATGAVGAAVQGAGAIARTGYKALEVAEETALSFVPGALPAVKHGVKPIAKHVLAPLAKAIGLPVAVLLAASHDPTMGPILHSLVGMFQSGVAAPIAHGVGEMAGSGAVQALQSQAAAHLVDAQAAASQGGGVGAALGQWGAQAQSAAVNQAAPLIQKGVSTVAENASEVGVMGAGAAGAVIATKASIDALVGQAKDQVGSILNWAKDKMGIETTYEAVSPPGTTQAQLPAQASKVESRPVVRMPLQIKAQEEAEPIPVEVLQQAPVQRKQAAIGAEPAPPPSPPPRQSKPPPRAAPAPRASPPKKTAPASPPAVVDPWNEGALDVAAVQVGKSVATSGQQEVIGDLDKMRDRFKAGDPEGALEAARILKDRLAKGRAEIEKFKKQKNLEAAKGAARDWLIFQEQIYQQIEKIQKEAGTFEDLPKDFNRQIGSIKGSVKKMRGKIESLVNEDFKNVADVWAPKPKTDELFAFAADSPPAQVAGEQGEAAVADGLRPGVIDRLKGAGGRIAKAVDSSKVDLGVAALSTVASQATGAVAGPIPAMAVDLIAALVARQVVHVVQQAIAVDKSRKELEGEDYESLPLIQKTLQNTGRAVQDLAQGANLGDRTRDLAGDVAGFTAGNLAALVIKAIQTALQGQLGVAVPSELVAQVLAASGIPLAGAPFGMAAAIHAQKALPAVQAAGDELYSFSGEDPRFVDLQKQFELAIQALAADSTLDAYRAVTLKPEFLEQIAAGEMTSVDLPALSEAQNQDYLEKIARLDEVMAAISGWATQGQTEMQPTWAPGSGFRGFRYRPGGEEHSDGELRRKAYVGLSADDLTTIADKLPELVQLLGDAGLFGQIKIPAERSEERIAAGYDQIVAHVENQESAVAAQAIISAWLEQQGIATTHLGIGADPGQSELREQDPRYFELASRLGIGSNTSTNGLLAQLIEMANEDADQAQYFLEKLFPEDVFRVDELLQQYRANLAVLQQAGQSVSVAEPVVEAVAPELPDAWAEPVFAPEDRADEVRRAILEATEGGGSAAADPWAVHEFVEDVRSAASEAVEVVLEESQAEVEAGLEDLSQFAAARSRPGGQWTAPISEILPGETDDAYQLRLDRERIERESRREMEREINQEAREKRKRKRRQTPTSPQEKLTDEDYLRLAALETEQKNADLPASAFAFDAAYEAVELKAERDQGQSPVEKKIAEYKAALSKGTEGLVSAAPALGKVLGGLGGAFQGLDKVFQFSLNNAEALLATVGGFVVVQQIIPHVNRLAHESIDLALKMEQLGAMFKFVFGGARQATAELEWVNQKIKEFALPMEAAIYNYGKFAVAVQGTAYEGDRAREIFEALSQAALVYELSQEQVNSVLLASQQIIGKGVVQSQELVIQLGQQLPGAVPKFAQSMGVSVAELQNMLSKGQVGLEDFYNFALFLAEDTASGVDDARKTTVAAINQLGRATAQFKAAIGEQLLPFVKIAVDSATEFVDSLQAAGDAIYWLLTPVRLLAEMVGTALAQIAQLPVIGSVLQFLGEVTGKIGLLLTGVAALTAAALALAVIIQAKVMPMLVSLGAGMLQLALAAGTKAAAAIASLSVAMAGASAQALTFDAITKAIAVTNPLLLALTAITTAAVAAGMALAYFANERDRAIADANEEIVEFNEEFSDAMSNLQRGIPLTAEKFKELSEKLSETATEEEKAAGHTKTLVEEFERLQEKAEKIAPLLDKFNKLVAESGREFELASDALNLYTAQIDAGIAEALQRGYLTADEARRKELDSQQNASQGMVKILEERRAALEEALAAIAEAEEIGFAITAEQIQQKEAAEKELNGVLQQIYQQRGEIARREIERATALIVQAEKDRQLEIQKLLGKGEVSQDEANLRLLESDLRRMREQIKAEGESADARIEILKKEIELKSALLEKQNKEGLIAIQEQLNRGEIYQAEAELRRLELTADRLAQQEQIEGRSADLTLERLENAYQIESAYRTLLIQKTEEQALAAQNAATAQEQSLDTVNRSLDRQVQLLNASKDLSEAINNLQNAELDIAQKVARTRREARQLAERQAQTRLMRLREALAVEEQMLELQLQQEQVQLRIQQAQSAAKLAQAQAEVAKTEADPEATDEQRVAAQLGVSAAEIELESLGTQEQLNEQMAQMRRATLRQRRSAELLQAEVDLAENTSNPNLRRSRRNQIRDGIQNRLRETPAEAIARSRIRPEEVSRRGESHLGQQFSQLFAQFTRGLGQISNPVDNRKEREDLSKTLKDLSASLNSSQNRNLTVELTQNFAAGQEGRVADRTRSDVIKVLQEVFK